MTHRASAPMPVLPRGATHLSCVIALYCILVKQSLAEDHLAAKWQDYQEEGERIRVISKYVGAEKAISSQLTLRAHAVYDSITGATPTGQPTEDKEGVVLSELTDVRKAAVVDVDWTRSVHKTTLQYSHSDEDDFLSRGVAVSGTTELNQRNTGLRYGIAFIDDDVRPEFFDEQREKTTWDFHGGVSQVVDPNTVVSFNLTYSAIAGYLSDPYKLVQKRTEILPDLFLDLTFPENRPEERLRRIALLNVKRFFPWANGSLDLDLRYFDDSWGIESQTVDIEWYQKIGERWIARPKYRLYRQDAARFYHFDLDATNLQPAEQPSQTSAHYSSDYRLAEFESRTYGLKVIYKASETLSWDVSFERYEMEGRDGITPQAAFPQANIVTIGGSWWY